MGFESGKRLRAVDEMGGWEVEYHLEGIPRVCAHPGKSSDESGSRCDRVIHRILALWQHRRAAGWRRLAGRTDGPVLGGDVAPCPPGPLTPYAVGRPGSGPFQISCQEPSA